MTHLDGIAIGLRCMEWEGSGNHNVLLRMCIRIGMSMNGFIGSQLSTGRPYYPDIGVSPKLLGWLIRPMRKMMTSRTSFWLGSAKKADGWSLSITLTTSTSHRVYSLRTDLKNILSS